MSKCSKCIFSDDFKIVNDIYVYNFPEINMGDEWYKSGAESWCLEVNNILRRIHAYFILSKSCNNIGDEFNRNTYIECAMNCVYSFRDKMSYFIYEVVGGAVAEKSLNYIDFKKLKNKTYIDIIKNSDRISDCEKEAIFDYINKIIEIENNTLIYKYRNMNIHRGNIGINSLGAATRNTILCSDEENCWYNGIFREENKIYKKNIDTSIYVDYDELCNMISNVINYYNKYNEELASKLSVFNK